MPCSKCNHKLILARVSITEIDPDPEPYESGEHIGLNTIDCDIGLDLHYCPNCKIIHDIWDDDGKHLID